VFKYELGKLKGHEAKIPLDPEATPKYCKARPEPYAMQARINSELERIERVRESLIKPIHFADWAAPTVPVIKADKKSVHICGDSKLTVNKAYSLRSIHEDGRRAELYKTGSLPGVQAGGAGGRVLKLCGY